MQLSEYLFLILSLTLEENLWYQLQSKTNTSLDTNPDLLNALCFFFLNHYFLKVFLFSDYLDNLK